MTLNKQSRSFKVIGGSAASQQLVSLNRYQATSRLMD